MKLCQLLLALLVATAAQKSNVLYIVVDDLRTELGCYENSSFSPSPHIDKLAESATVFERAYCSQAVCSPSRNSFLTGRVPDRTQIWNFHGSFRDREKEEGAGSWVSLPQWFKQNGWITAGMGKVFHPNSPPNNDPVSWTLPYFKPPSGAECAIKQGNVSHNYSCVADEELTPDYKIASHALGIISNLTAQRNANLTAGGNPSPWFVAVGFHRPHLDWQAPQWAFDMHPLNASWVGPVRGAISTAPDGMPAEAFYSWNNQDSRGFTTFSYFDQVR
jgi:arylsulfatase A-like enzyme